VSLHNAGIVYQSLVECRLHQAATKATIAVTDMHFQQQPLHMPYGSLIISRRGEGGGVGQVCGAIALPTGLGWAPRLLQINLTYIRHLPLAWLVQEMPAGLGKLAANAQTWKTRHLEPMVLAAGQLLQAKSHHKLKPP